MKRLKEEYYDDGIFSAIEEALYNAGFEVSRFSDAGILTKNLGWEVYHPDYDDTVQLSCLGTYYSESVKRVKKEDYENDTREAELVIDTLNELWNDASIFAQARITGHNDPLNRATEKLLDALDEYFDYIKNRYNINDFILENRKYVKENRYYSMNVNELVNELEDLQLSLINLAFYDSYAQSKKDKFLGALTEYIDYLSDYTF